MKVLVVDDDRDLLELLEFALGRAGFESVLAQDAPTAMKSLQDAPADIAVLDVNLGASNGFDLLRDMRRTTDMPVIMLTARDSEADKVHGLELGADDYVVKPFGPRELIARIRAHLRRTGREVGERDTRRIFEVGPLVLDVGEHSVTKGGEPVHLTVTEFRFLHALMLDAGRVVPMRTLLRKVWGYDDPAGADVFRMTLYRLRRKLEDEPSTPRLLHTVAGVGVMLKPT